MTRIAVPLLMLCVVAMHQHAASAAILPHATIQQMAFEADLLVRGKYLGEGVVEVEDIFFNVGDQQVPDHLEVPALAQHTLRLWPHGREGQPPPALQPERVYLFLERTEGAPLRPMHAIGEGSQGVVWVAEDRLYRYSQVLNPGPYVLGEMARETPHMPAREDALVQKIETSLVLRTRWEQVHQTLDRRERARRMVDFMLPATAPEGLEAETLDLRRELRAIGGEVVEFLIPALEDRRDGRTLNDIALALYDIGQKHPEAIRPAVPALILLLEDPPDNASPYYLLSPLTAAGDPRAIEVVRPYLDHGSDQVRGEAARALAAMKDMESFDEIADKLRAAEDPKRRLDSTLAFARALFELDPQRAVPIIRNAERQEAARGISAFIQGFPRESS